MLEAEEIILDCRHHIPCYSSYYFNLFDRNNDGYIHKEEETLPKTMDERQGKERQHHNLNIRREDAQGCSGWCQSCFKLLTFGQVLIQSKYFD
jgi:hypothetical protein